MKTRNQYANWFIVIVLILGWPIVSESSEVQYRWYVINSELSEKGQSLSIGSAQQRIQLRGGWSCNISKTSINNGRQTTCTKGIEQIEFSVMCDLNRPKDHTQIRFRTPNAKAFYDFIEVGCKPRA